MAVANVNRFLIGYAEDYPSNLFLCKFEIVALSYQGNATIMNPVLLNYRNIEPNPLNVPRLILLKLTTSSHPKSLAAKGGTETIVVGGVPNRRAPPANNAPFCIQSRACRPADVKVLSEFTSLSHEETQSMKSCHTCPSNWDHRYYYQRYCS